MRVPYVMIISILLLVSSIFSDARTTPAEEYWKNVMKDVPMPKVVKDLVDSDSEAFDSRSSKEDSYFTRDFDAKPGLLEDYLKYFGNTQDSVPSNKKSFFTRNFDKKSGQEFHHPSNPRWLHKYIQYKIASYLIDAPAYVKSYFTKKLDLDLKSAWEYYHSRNPKWLDLADSVSSNKKSFFTREFDGDHAWEWYYE